MSFSERRRASALESANGRRGWSGALSFMWEWGRIILMALIAFAFVRAFFVQAFKIPTGSMQGTLLPGDFLLVNKLVYGAEVPFTKLKLPAVRTPQRGDIIVFQYPVDPSTDFVKRIVGMPGDTLEMRDGVLIRDGKIQREPYAVHVEPGSDATSEQFKWQLGYLLGANDPVKVPPRSPLSVESLHASPNGYHPTRNNWGPIVVPERNYFVLGDNRDNSLDSRYWGWVADSLVRGQPLVVYYSYDPDGAVKLDWITRVRWKRFGEMIQ